MPGPRIQGPLGDVSTCWQRDRRIGARRKGRLLNADGLRRALGTHFDALVAFCQRLVQTPSPPGQEAAVAALVRDEMQRLGYAEVRVDAAGNVIGHVPGGPGRSLMLNSHLDHVDPGDPARWPVPPFSGRVEDGRLWGRGAMDIKGPLACQVYAPALLRTAGIQAPGDLFVTATVMEEVGGIGARHLAGELRPDAAVVGEATGCRVARGHRGRVELVLRFTGKSGHASAPERAANPHYAAARFLSALETLPMAQGPSFGSATVAPTLYQTDQTSANVIPEQVTLTLDWRSIPEEGPEQALERVSALAASLQVPGVTVEAQVPSLSWQTYTGLTRAWPSVFPAFELAETHPLVTAARACLAQVYGEAVPSHLWRFATDGGHFVAAGIPTVGFGPGEERLAHTTEEHISLDQLARGLLGNAALCAGLGEVDF